MAIPEGERANVKYTFSVSLRKEEEEKVLEGVKFVSSILNKKTGAGSGVDFFRDPKDPRAHYNGRGGINVGSFAMWSEIPGVIAHEIGHHIEHNAPGVRKVVQKFLEDRTRGEAPTDLSTISSSYKRGEEFGKKDKFDKYFDKLSAYYVGKSYSHGATEVLSMGIQALMENPFKFLKRDPEYANFVLGVLDGSVR